MAYENFKQELMKLLKVKELTEETPLSSLDSMSKTEICMLAEEELNIELQYSEVNEACKGTYLDLQDLLADKGYGP